MLKIQKTIAQRNAHSGLWSITFDIIRVLDNGESYISAECQSGAVFATAAEAHDAGDRAVTHYELNDGRFPNMCEVW